MKLGIMQPYFLPYIGYFQLIAAVDTFVVYDNIKYTKKGWINRNRLLCNGSDKVFSLPLKRASDSLDVVDREIAPDFKPSSLLNQFRGAYAHAPYFTDVYKLLEEICCFRDLNLFSFVYHSIKKVMQYLNISTSLLVSSSLQIAAALTGQDRVIAQCEALHASQYINAIGGTELYDRSTFDEKNIKLSFLQPSLAEYAQLGNAFVPGLSIVDVMMFNARDVIGDSLLHHYKLV